MANSYYKLFSVIRFQMVILIPLWNMVWVKAENKDDFVFVLDKSVQKMYEDPEDCITYTQGFLINEQLADHRIILQNVMAQAYALKGDYVQSIRMSLDNENLESYGDLSPQFTQFFLDYALAEQYQSLGLYHQSEKIITRILRQNKTKSLDFIEQITLAKVYQLHGINLSVLKKYKESNQIFEFANQNLLKYTQENEILKFENKVFISGNYFQLKEYAKAKAILLSLLEELNQFPHAHFLHALAKERLSRIYFIEGEYTQSILLLEEALQKLEHTNYLYLQSKIYQGLSKNFLAQGEVQNSQKYQKKFVVAEKILLNNSKEGIRYLLQLTESNEKKNISFIQQKYKEYKWSMGIVFLVLVSLLVLLLIHLRNRQKDLKKQFDFFTHQEEYFRLKNSEKHEPLNNDSKKEKKPVIISKETEKDLLEKLMEFEKSDRFLNNEMSLALLAGQLETNTKYLSEVINNYKGKNFSTYINELRINHIAYLLKKEPAYLNYKVSYLAEVAGFTSHSSFTTVFKSVTGISPNAYIQQLSKTTSK